MIGADQVLALGEELFDKPGDLAAAREQLLRLRGKTHRLHLGGGACRGRKGCLDPCRRSCTDHAALQPEHFSTATWQRRTLAYASIVGAYEIEGRGIQLFERIEGDTSPSSACRCCRCWPSSGRAGSIDA